MVITSLENERVKNLVKLREKKYRDLTGHYLVEGYHLVEEAYKAGVVLELFALEDENILFDVPYTYVSVEVMKKITTMESISPIVAVCKKNSSTEIIGDKILLLDGVQDPGNLGTMIRSAVAFHIDTIILGNGTVDLYNPKVLRATQGMYNHLNVIRKEASLAIEELHEKNIIVYGTNVVDGVDVRTLSPLEKSKYCLVMGNEGNGVTERVQSLCDKNLYIQMDSKVESLNVAIACSILLYELGR